MDRGQLEGMSRMREQMVESQIASRGIRDERVLEAMRKVPRERFVRDRDISMAFFDGPLSIGCGQTISQPYIVAYMTEKMGLKSDSRVLEVGTGSGYQTAVLAEIAAAVFTVEIVEDLSMQARSKLVELGYSNIRFLVGDGCDGWPDESPFDSIIVTASPAIVPQRLVEQLSDGGTMILPVGVHSQYLELVKRRGETVESERLIAVRFVPMTGRIERD